MANLEGNVFSLRKKFFKLFGGAFTITNEAGEVVLFADQKAFKMKEAIHVFTNEEKTEEVFQIKARSIIDFGATYDVMDLSGNIIGSLKRKGLKSILRDEWLVLDSAGNEIGLVTEDNAVIAMIRRTILPIVPQKYDLMMGEKRVCNLDQNFNPFIYKLLIDFSENTENKLEKRVGFAAAILLAAIEGKQS
jgi:uncharacterized protein YxjI